MAFNAANLSKWSPFNEPGPQLFGYVTKTDNVATVSASTYFTPFADSFSQSLLPFPFNVGDTIQCTCSDANVNLTVTAINPIATTEETVDLIVGPNSVNTAAIQNLAVTAAKIANGTITTTQISASAGITGSQLANTTVAAGNIVNGTITTTQISASAGITGSQLSASAAIAGTQLAAGANIAGSQLAAAAGIVGTQLAANTLNDTEIVAGGISSVSLAATTIQYVKVPMTAAQWNGMYGAPFIMIATPGANKMINVIRAVAAMTFVSANYAAGGAVALQYDTTIHGAGTLASGTIAAATVNGYGASSQVSLDGLVASSASTTTINKGLYLSNLSGAFTTGDGTWNIHIWYEIVTL